MKRKVTQALPGPIPRAMHRAEGSTFRLPTIAAIAAAMAVTSASFSARAIVGGDTGVQEETGDAADDSADAEDAPDVQPISCPPPLGGVQPPMRVHGTGCGCGSEGNEESGMALAAATLAVATVIGRRRR